MRTRILVSLVVFACAPVLGAQDGQGLADRILKSADRGGGLCVMVNMSDPEPAVTIGKQSRFIVQAILEKADAVRAMREAVDRSGLYGRVSAEQASPSRLPYAENLINVLVVDSYSRLCEGGMTLAEVSRVLAPYGVVWLHGSSDADAAAVCASLEASGWSAATKTADRWVYATKPYPREVDEWTHFRHNAEGNMVSEDTIVGPPRHVQWVAEPMWQRHHALTPSTTTMVGSHGRLFYIQDESPVGFAGIRGKWMLIGRDAFNGKLLWKRPMGDWGDEVWSWWSGGHSARFNSPENIVNRLVASEDRVFVTLGFNAPVSALDPDTGETRLAYRGTDYADEMVYRDGVLYLSVNDRPQKPLPGVGFSVTPTANNPSVKTIWALEANTGNVLWKSGPFSGLAVRDDRMGSMRPVILTASEKGVFLFDQDALVGLDLKTGGERFRTPAKVSDKTALVYHRGLLLVGEKGTLSAFDAQTGKPKWQSGISPIGHLTPPEVFAVGDVVWVGESGRMEIKALDCATGEEKKRVSVEKVLADAGHHHRCYPNKSTTTCFISGRRAAEFTNYETGAVTLNHWARGECRYGLMPANGLLYKLPDPCSCYLKAKLLGFYALAPEKTAEAFFGDRSSIQNPFEKGPAFGAVPKKAFSAASEWPTFRHDPMRSSSVETALPGALKKVWEVQLRAPLTPPVVAGGQVYVASSDEHKIQAFDEKSGRPLWTHRAGGRIDSPPTLYGGSVLFGSADGWVYCLRASDGQQAWRFRAAPYDRKIMARDQVESAWPVHGSVLLADGIVYCTAGRSSFVDGGIYLYALEADTGRVVGRNTIHEVQTKDRTSAGAMPEETPGARSDILVTNGEQVFMTYRALEFSVPLKKGANDYLFDSRDHLDSGSSFFDSFWFHRAWWTYGKMPGYIIAFDREAAYSLYTFEGTGGSNYKLYVPPNGDATMIPDSNTASAKESGIQHVAAVRKGGLILQKCTGKQVERLDEDFPVGAVAMVLTGEELLVAGGFMGAFQASDPWANFEERKKSVLWVLSKTNGKARAVYDLETLPVWNGMAAANGKVFLSLKNGKLLCMGQ